jgi:hypothetical protein
MTESDTKAISASTISVPRLLPAVAVQQTASEAATFPSCLISGVNAFTHRSCLAAYVRPDVARFYRFFRTGLCAGLIGRGTGGE